MRVPAAIIMAGLALAAGGCAGRQATEAAGPSLALLGPLPGQLEAIHAVAFTADQAVFWVSSNGCTAREDLLPVVSREPRPTITLRRLTDDRCDKPLADGVQVAWSFEELGLPRGARPAINNPYQLPQS